MGAKPQRSGAVDLIHFKEWDADIVLFSRARRDGALFPLLTSVRNGIAPIRL
jgi:hypothetical protein